jgi:hypothetical protein
MTAANIRLACSECDRDDKDGITAEQLAQCEVQGWTNIIVVQSFEDACRTYDDPAAAPKGHDSTAWYTHLGLCPDCQLENP